MTDMTDIPDMTDAISAGQRAKDRIINWGCRCRALVLLPGKRRPQPQHHLCSYVDNVHQSKLTVCESRV